MTRPPLKLKLPLQYIPLRAAALIVLAATLACGDAANNVPTVRPATTTPTPAMNKACIDSDMHPYEREARNISAALPSFGGMTIDTVTGSAIAFVTDLRDSVSARDAVSAATEVP